MSMIPEVVPGRDPEISVIIPTLNEGELIGEAIDSAIAGSSVEIIVVDGGSRDRTFDVAASKCVRVISAPRGRALQMNAGARIAGGNLFVFLHADTVLPPDFARLVRELLADPQNSAGAFGFALEGSSWKHRAITWGANARSRFLSLPYGDQALFMRRSVFETLGGYPEIAVMEDFELVLRLRRIGRIAVAPALVRTSSRRWWRQGFLRTILINQCCTLAHLAGVSSNRIAKWRDGR